MKWWRKINDANFQSDGDRGQNEESESVRVEWVNRMSPVAILDRRELFFHHGRNGFLSCPVYFKRSVLRDIVREKERGRERDRMPALHY